MLLPPPLLLSLLLATLNQLPSLQVLQRLLACNQPPRKLIMLLPPPLLLSLLLSTLNQLPSLQVLQRLLACNQPPRKLHDAAAAGTAVIAAAVNA
jgi:hypothetical protein